VIIVDVTRTVKIL